jgi:hemolysin III
LRGAAPFADALSTSMASRVKPPPDTYSPAEDLANALTHGIGLLLSVAALAWLVTASYRRGDGWHITATAVFGAALVLLYASSTLYHSLRGESQKRLLRKFDHAAIFILIAGTYTPFLLITLRGAWGWSLFGVVWTLALAGVAVKFWFTGRFQVTSTLLYVGMGWLMLVALQPLWRTLAPGGMWLLLGGGICYTGGTVFYLWKRLPFHHAFWHLFVLGGSACHVFAVGVYVIPRAG